MSHPFGDLLSQHLHRKHGLSQSKLAAGILQDPAIIGKMCKGERLSGPQARERVLAMIGWLRTQGALTSVTEANALLRAAGKVTLQERDPVEAALLQQLGGQPAIDLFRPSSRPPWRVGQDGLTPHTNLPTSPMPLIGREKEVAAIQQRLSDTQCRLLTLVGPGGIGKTRLAIEVAAARRATYRDGVCFVNLQSTPSTEALPVAIADTLHIALASTEAPQQQVQQYLAEKAMLLVLDNFEHLLDGATALAELLVAAPAVQLLVTSREVLNLREEWLFWVQGIAYPPAASAGSLLGAHPSSGVENPLGAPARPGAADGGHPEGSRQALSRQNGDDLGSYDAVRLFQEHAQRLQPAFALESNAAAVVRICQLSEGMPLALELAASWVKSLPCAEIAEELASGLTILSTPLRNIPERHRTMRVVFEQSWRRLSEQEQAVFQRLSVFRGGFRREAAQQVVGATLPLLSVLVDHCLLQQEADGRYQIHELLRQYGEERLAESQEAVAQVQERHCVYYADLLARTARLLTFGSQLETIAALSPELDNLRTLWRWAVEHGKADAIYNATAAYVWICQFQNRYLEGFNAFNAAAQCLTPQAESPPVVAALLEVLPALAGMALRLGRLEQAEAAASQSMLLRRKHNYLSLSDWSNGGLSILSMIAAIRGEYAQAEKLAREEIALLNATNQDNNHPDASWALANALLAQGKIEAAYQAATEAVNVCRQVNHNWFLAYCLNTLGDIIYAQGDLSTARQHYQAAYAIREAYDDLEGMAVALNHLGEVALAEEEPDVAQEHYERSLALYREINDRGGRATATKGLGDVARSQGQYLIAESYYQQALQIALEIRYMSLVFKLLLAIANLFLLTNRRKNGVELLAFVIHHPASDYTRKEEACETLERLGEYPAPSIQEITWQAASPQWAALLRLV